jgi:hypothetical protein
MSSRNAACASDQSPANEFLDHAIEHARRRWSIIPVVGKKSKGLWKPFQEQPADERMLRQLFSAADITGLAVVTGSVSGGLAVRDFDLADSYEAWAAQHPNDASSLPTVQTARGMHVYGRLDEEVFANLGDGELRAACTHYVLLPPSVHPTGAVYRWVNPLPAGATPLPLLTDVARPDFPGHS